jgi:hypothetical protein
MSQKMGRRNNMFYSVQDWILRNLSSYRGFFAYLHEVPRWIPNLKKLNLSKSGEFKWWDAIRSEIPSVYVWLLAILIFVMKEFFSVMVDIR